MIIDGLLLFTGTSSGATGVPSIGPNTDRPTTGSQTSSVIVDLHMAGIPVLASGQGARDIGIGDDPALKILLLITATFTGGASLAVALQGSPDNGSGAPAGFVTYYSTAVIAEANLLVGTRLMDMDVPRPPPGVAIPRFLQLAYTSVGTHTAGALEGAIVLDRHDQPYSGTTNSVLGGYPAGINVAN